MSSRGGPSPDSEPAPLFNRVAAAAQCALPGALLIYFAFNAGGFFPGPPSLVAVVLALGLVAYTTVALRPFAGISFPSGLAIAALALFTGWTFLSQNWSHAPGRATTEATRALLYLLVVVILGSTANNRERLRWMVRGVAFAALVVCTAALATRLFPDAFHTSAGVANQRLAFPITYWNVLGLVAGVGIILGLHLASSREEWPVTRVISAAAVPLLATTLYCTFSRGAIVVTIVGAFVYAVLARERLVIPGLLATLPLIAGAVIAAYDANLLATPNPTTHAAASQGHRVAIVVIACIAAAGLLRWLLCRFVDDRVLDIRTTADQRRATWGAIAATVVAGIVIAVAAGAPGTLSHDWHRFFSGAAPTGNGTDLRARLLDPANNGRTPAWKASLHEYRSSPLRGQGAGMFQVYWNSHRTVAQPIRNAHSLYLEVLGDLGLVGLALLAACFIALLVGGGRRLLRPIPAVYAAITAVFVAWLIRAGVDWDWQMPVITAPVLALAAAAAAHRRNLRLTPLSQGARVYLGVAWLAVAVMPALVYLSQGRIDGSVNDLFAGRFPAARSQALSSLSFVADRPQAYELIGYSDLEEQRPVAAISAMHQALKRDARNWQYWDGLAVAQAAAGTDPRAAARQAVALNPLDDLPHQILVAFKNPSPSQWQANASDQRDAMLASGVVGAY